MAELKLGGKLLRKKNNTEMKIDIKYNICS